uniref:Putative glycosyltransferase n=1 Tax=viral metagenome TaxID=1070528 RepID=A0A6M3IMC6_9ZZZZ
MNPVNSIIRQSIRQYNEPLNIICAATHESYESGLAKTGHTFYALRKINQIKDWNCQYRSIPSNYILLPEDGTLPNHIQLDLVLSQNKFSQFQTLYPIAQTLQLPIISLEHTLPPPNVPDGYFQNANNARGHINVFISEFSLRVWKWDNRGDTCVIKHCIDTSLFKPGDTLRENHILSVVNDWINRDWCCNFQGWQRITQGLPVRIIGDTPGLSKPAPSTQALVNEYQSSKIFLNTSTVSPIPTSLLESMSCGCACVSTATCMIPEIIQDGVNGFISNDENILKERLRQLLSDNKLCEALGKNARQTILKDFNQKRFVDQWNDVFRRVTQ